MNTFSTVHTHDKGVCNERKICGSSSVKLSVAPKDVRVRYRFHPDSDLSDENSANLVDIEDTGDAASLSAQIYGVFDEKKRIYSVASSAYFPQL